MEQSESPNAVTTEAVLVVVAAGKGTRAGGGIAKQFRLLGGVPVLARSLRSFARVPRIKRAVVVVPEPDTARRALRGLLPPGLRVEFVAGGRTRQASTLRGLERASPEPLVVVHDGVRPFVDRALAERVLEAAIAHGAAIPVLPVRDTPKRLGPDEIVSGTLSREGLVAAQTPQAFRRELLEAALRTAAQEGYEGTDEAEAVERVGHQVVTVPGHPANLKLTTQEDFEMAERLVGPPEKDLSERVRIGLGYDTHSLEKGRRLVLGGVEIPHPAGPKGHSDGDLVCHAVTDALLGAAGLPDIGQLFPDTDPTLRGASSLDLLARVGVKIHEAGFSLINVDVVVVAEEPMLAPHVEAMRENLSRALGTAVSSIGLRGKRGEGLGYVGRKEGMTAHAVTLLRHLGPEGEGALSERGE